ncbi:MAG TPA: Hpt domain-containing protein [Nitrospira sp.]|nr:Hpt domain-containing protein [Nitrospira sp.]MCW5796094.1 Hpt domain-containing protein [Nitrospira sp.]HMW87200.1 Hpt domain-containing protein [Nitrospira sp.]HMX92377.1 Hpt domain-containing protein [Nitrospira sp.]HNC82772.1 Hpt domain-containing protein [Nitrospira sp.]
MSADFDRDQLLDIFVAEAGDDMERFWKALHPEGKGRPEPAEVAEFHAVGHKLKGAALLYGFPGLGQLGALLEETLEHVQEMSPSQWPAAFEVIRDIVASFRHQVTRIGRGEGEDASLVEGFVQRCAQFLPAASADDSSQCLPIATEPADDYLLPVMDEEVLSYFAPEAEEYLNTIQTLLQRLELDLSDAETIHQLYRVAHTLKGSAYTVGFQVVGDVAFPIETCMIAVREGAAVIGPQWIATIRHAVDVMRSLMARDAQQLPRLRQDVPCMTTMLRELEQGMTQAPQVDAPAASSSSVAAEEALPPAAKPLNPAAQLSEPNHPAELSEAYLIPMLDAEVISYFAPEAQEYLESLETDLLRVDKDAANPDIIHQLFRTAHTLKGSAYTVGFQSIGDLTHHIEDFMGAVREGRLKFLPGHTDVLLRAIDVIRALMRRDPSLVTRTRQRFAASLQELKGLGEAAPAGVHEPVMSSQTEAVIALDVQEAEQAEPVNAAEGKAGEEREVIRVSRDRLERLLNLVGELVIDRGRLEQRLRTLDQLATQVLANKNRLTDAVRTFEDKHTFSFQPSPTTQGEAMPQGFPGVSDFGSLEFDKYDDFNILARRISEVTADISESMSQLSGSIHRAQDDMGSLQQLTLGMRDEIARARMVPIGTPFTRFRRAAREMARATGKDVNLVTSGEHTEIDTGVVERLVDPLVHLVRNAVYHGIEPAAVRRVQGKPETGTIYLHAAHRGNSVLIEVEDDGAGLDIAKIKAKAVKLGLVRQDVAETLPESEVIKFIFLPGFSTADAVGDQAGRGVGMDVVKRVIETMNGHIEVESVRGQGTKFTMHLPLTLLIATALLVRVGKDRYAIPLPSVREVTMSTASTLQHMGDRQVVQIGDEAIEVYPLGSLIRREAGITDGVSPVVIVRTSTGALGCAVDELLGRQEIVIKSLGGLKPYERSVFGGATIDPEGRVVLVLDVSRLTTREYQETMSIAQDSSVAAIEDATGHSEPKASAPSALPLLLIDDSLSIRKFVGRMLEAAGYTVETATDGEEGCRKAMVQAYQLIITDLEMPKLNGYEVIQALRARPQTHATPILVMTTRAGEKHRQMAVSVGASGYIAKPVEERALIQEVRKWTGVEARAEK